MKFVIVGHRSQGGGAVVQHSLCKMLEELGQNAKMIYFARGNYDNQSHLIFWLKWIIYSIKITIKSVVEFVLGPNRLKGYFDISPYLRTVKRKYLPFVGKNTIVVYTETFFGNPLHAQNVVRWLLYYNSIYKQDGEKTIGYDKNDLFFTYRSIFNDPKLNPDCKLLNISYYDLDLYKRTNFGKRSGKCYVLKKGAWRVKDSDCDDGIIIDNFTEKEKVRIFNECEYSISYDTQTAYSYIAAMCGCISIVMPENGKSGKDYRTNGEFRYGQAFGFSEEEIQFAIATRDKIKERLLKCNQNSREQTKAFLEECEKYFL